MMREEDKRKFKRYASGSECEVILPSGRYKGKINDYSDGVGIELENVPDLIQGAEIDIKAIDHDLAFRGAVAWVRSTGQYLKAGIRRIDAFKGNLRDFVFAEILIGINRSAGTGSIEIKKGLLARNIFIDKGDVVFAVSNDKNDHLGERLVKKGKITLIEFDNASHLLRKTGKRLGKILVELGYLAPSELYQEVRQQIEDIIISHFQWEEGEFEFKESPIPSDEVIPLKISTANIIYRGVKKIDNFELIKQMCPSADDILNASHNPVRIFQSLNLEDTDKKILSYINGIYPLKTILSLSPLPNFETLKTLSALISIGLIYVKEERDAPMTLPVEEIFGKTEEIAPQDYMEKIEEVFHKCETCGYYEALGVARDASVEEINKSYFQLLKQFHPDRHFSFPSLDIKDKLLKIISYTTEGYEILSDPKKRREYDKTRMLTDSPTSSSSHIYKMEKQDSFIKDKTKETIHIELPDDIVTCGTQEERPIYNLDCEQESGSNESLEDPAHNVIPDDTMQNEERIDAFEENVHKRVEEVDLPNSKVPSIMQEDAVAFSETPMDGQLTTPLPTWVLDPAYGTPEESAVQREIADISRRISELQQESNKLAQQMDAAGSIRALLYEQGKELELAVRDALTVLGFSVRPLKESDSEFDISFDSPEGRCLGNIEGKDNMAINIDRFSQLERNLQEDFSREGVTEYAKGVLFGNAERLKPLPDRGEAFTLKCVTAAKRGHVALIQTADLFEPVRYLRSHPDPDYAKICRKAILDAEGDIVTFPPASIHE
jgi:curved DNA-binding protein CbpA